MKTKLMAAVAAIAVMTATGAARAQTADSTNIKTLKAESDALKKQNQALEQRLNKLEQQQQQAAAKPRRAASWRLTCPSSRVARRSALRSPWTAR